MKKLFTFLALFMLAATVAWADEYDLTTYFATIVSITNELKVGDKIVITGGTNNNTGTDRRYVEAVMSTNMHSSGKYIQSANGAIHYFANTIDSLWAATPYGVEVFTLVPGKNGHLALRTRAGKYLSAVSSSANNMGWSDVIDDNSSVSIEFTADSAAIIKFQGDYTRNTIRYINQSSTTSYFSCFGSSSSGLPVYIYRETYFTATTLESIAMTGSPAKTSYTEDDTFDPTGLGITATYSNDSTAVADAGDIAWSANPTPLTTGTKTVAVTGTYGGRSVSKNFAVSVTAKARYTVTVVAPDNGTLTVQDGETTIASGTQVKDGTVLTVTATPATGYKFRNWQAVDASTHTFTVGTEYTVSGHDVTFKANFDEITALSSIAVAGSPVKTDYYIGEEFSTDGLTVTATHLDGSTDEGITEDVEWTVTPSPLAAGTTSVTVTAAYAGLTAQATYDVVVTKRPESYTATIVWSGNGATNDGSQIKTSDALMAITNEDAVTNLVESYDIASDGLIYQGRGDMGLKFGSASKIGAFTINFKDSIAIAHIALSASRFNAGTGKLTFVANDSTYQVELTNEDQNTLLDYDIDLDGALVKSLTVSTDASNRRAFLRSLTLTINNPVEPDPEPETATGDVNADGVVDVDDVNVLINIVLGNTSKDAVAGVPDLTDDGVIDIDDVNALINIILGK